MKKGTFTFKEIVSIKYIEIIFYLTNREILHLTLLILSRIFSERCFLFYTRLQCLNLALKSLLLIPVLSIVNAKCFN